MENFEKRGYLLENFRLFHLRSAQGVKVQYHYHDFCKLLFLVSGEGSYTVDGHRYDLRSGDVVRIGSRSVHCPEFSGEYARIILYIDPDYLRLASTEDCDLTALFLPGGSHVLRLRESERRKVFSLVEALERELSGDNYGRVILSQGALLRLLVQLLRLLRQSDSQDLLPVTLPNPRIQEVKAYLDAHLTEDIQVDDLARIFYISKFHMMRLFHQQMGITVHNYLSQRRLLHARDLIERGMRATEACYRSGFRSYSSFTRAYSKHFGTTPTGRANAATRPEEELE